MIWSYSGYRQFVKCNRQWYYQHKVADHKADDAFRREVAVLSSLKTLDAWRGELADQIISRLVYRIWKGAGISYDDVIWQINQTFNEQLEFARQKTYRNQGFKMPDFGDISALYVIDTDQEIDDTEIERARRDIHKSVETFLNQHDLIDYLRTASHVLTQRTLRHPFSNFEVVGRPDLIALFEDEPPHIFDWKVHTFATKTYKEQLVHYAMMLYKRNDLNPHKDFPDNLSQFDVLDYRLTEFQLLIGQVRNHEITEEDIEDAERNISSGLLGMFRLGGNKDHSELSADQFPTAFDAEACLKCTFKSICKN